ncbi:MAG TPA: hypothetical protein VGT78_14745 [Rhizomicrobium sp.]|nr:hypothetical protein [Rhizomicrobium sp.]
MTTPNTSHANSFIARHDASTSFAVMNKKHRASIALLLMELEPIAVANQRQQTSATRRLQRDRNSGAHAPDSHTAAQSGIHIGNKMSDFTQGSIEVTGSRLVLFLLSSDMLEMLRGF